MKAISPAKAAEVGAKMTPGQMRAAGTARRTGLMAEMLTIHEIARP